MAKYVLADGDTAAVFLAGFNNNSDQAYAPVTGVAGGQTLIGSTLTNEDLNLRSNAADTTTGSVNVLDSLEASSKTVGALTVAGGLAVGKKIYGGATTIDSLTVGSLAGILKGTAGAVSAATGGTDYIVPAGFTGGQAIEGGTGAAEALTLTSTHHATKGVVNLGGDGGTNCLQVEADGTLLMKGTATVWNDIIVQAGNLRVGTTPPAFAAFTGGIYAPSFVAGQADEVHGCFEIPHDYKEGTDLVAHIHCAPSTTNAGNLVVGFEYEALSDGATATSTTNTPIDPTAMSGVAKKVEKIDIATIPGSGRKIGDIVPFRFYRQNGGTDTFTGDLFVLSIGLHYESDTVGSRAITTK